MRKILKHDLQHLVRSIFFKSLKKMYFDCVTCNRLWLFRANPGSNMSSVSLALRKKRLNERPF